MLIMENSNKQIVEEIRKRLKQNDNYCPCYIIKNEDTKCLCKDFRESKKIGLCHCGLYRKVEI